MRMNFSQSILSYVNSRRLFATFCLMLSLITLTSQDRVLAEEKRNRILTVSGRGAVMIPTTQTLVRLGVEIRGETAQQVQEEVAKRSSAVIDLLRSRGVEKLQTTGITLNPNYIYQNNTQVLKGYIGTNGVSFKINTQGVGPLLDEAVKAGATRIENISFVANDNDILTAQKQALREATQEAQQQADVVLSHLNLTRKEVVNIAINSVNVPIPHHNLRGGAMMAQESVSTPVVGGEQQVEASVTLQISY